MGKPLIGIVCGPHLECDNSNLFYGLYPAYSKSVEMAGGLPVMVMPTLSPESLRDIYERLDGVLIAGGGDIDPASYGMSDDGLVSEVDPARDNAEFQMTRWAAEDNKPLLGICRGCQVANVALGGTLYRDIKAEYPHVNGIQHDNWGKFPRNYHAHTVNVKPGTHLANALGAPTIEVNSLHHQGLRDVAPGLVITANAPDGLIEAVELPEKRFFVAVQWHPEELTKESMQMRSLFEAFVRESDRSK